MKTCEVTLVFVVPDTTEDIDERLANIIMRALRADEQLVQVACMETPGVHLD